jgi:hypothetical protein
MMTTIDPFECFYVAIGGKLNVWIHRHLIDLTLSV